MYVASEGKKNVKINKNNCNSKYPTSADVGRNDLRNLMMPYEGLFWKNFQRIKNSIICT